MYSVWRYKLLLATPILTLALFAPRSGRLLSSSGWYGPRFLAGVPRIMAQNEESGEKEVSTDEIEKYVSVYKAMQRNRSITVDQAAAAQGLTTEQFRQLENRVERDDAALQQARDELQAAAQGSPASGQTPAPHP